jgi:hypothetical protein
MLLPAASKPAVPRRLKLKLPALASGPSVEIELMESEFVTYLDRVSAFTHVRSLANCQRLMASKPEPIQPVPKLAVRDISREREDGKAGSLVKQTASCRFPTVCRPSPHPHSGGVPPMYQRSQEIVA